MKTLAERWVEDRFASQPHNMKWEDFQALSGLLDAMFTELRADLVGEPSHAKISDVGYIQSQMGTFPRMADHVASLKAKTSDVEVTDAMVQAGGDAYWKEMKPNVGPGLHIGLRVAYRAMRALEPKRPVEITDDAVRRALRRFRHEDWRYLFSPGEMHAMREAIQAALTPNEEETR